MSMSQLKPSTTGRYLLAICLLCALLPTSQASVRVLGPGAYSGDAMTCEAPVRLVHDCSVWRGATLPIAFGGFRMTLAADSDGRTILVSRVRRGPDHNGSRFRRMAGSKARLLHAAQAIDLIGAALQDRGIRLQRVQPLGHGRRVTGFFLEFSDNAYDYLRQFTVLESEHWLPKRQASR